MGFFASLRMTVVKRQILGPHLSNGKSSNGKTATAKQQRQKQQGQKQQGRKDRGSLKITLLSVSQSMGGEG
jgi:hypothetical protein